MRRYFDQVVTLRLSRETAKRVEAASDVLEIPRASVLRLALARGLEHIGVSESSPVARAAPAEEIEGPYSAGGDADEAAGRPAPRRACGRAHRPVSARRCTGKQKDAE